MQKSPKQEMECLLKGQLVLLNIQIHNLHSQTDVKDQSPTGGQEGQGKGKK